MPLDSWFVPNYYFVVIWGFVFGYFCSFALVYNLSLTSLWTRSRPLICLGSVAQIGWQLRIKSSRSVHECLRDPIRTSLHQELVCWAPGGRGVSHYTDDFLMAVWLVSAWKDVPLSLSLFVFTLHLVFLPDLRRDGLLSSELAPFRPVALGSGFLRWWLRDVRSEGGSAALLPPLCHRVRWGPTRCPLPFVWVSVTSGLVSRRPRWLWDVRKINPRAASGSKQSSRPQL